MRRDWQRGYRIVPMTDKLHDPAPPDRPADSRQERLAAQLRANLRRRKAQGRAQADARTGEDGVGDESGEG
ncbi:hypothetical protein LWE61_00850 [Sphingobium sufflavum]|uniref:hypothetical protein n=1 Tax=Sphingobium sufflavum TaxID=1129547 RepID=UPI001F293241|nr:hypothetical protein [Sphingobium sufflavum]MCE7795097.1 hypothetical protein [Sphingobium sufflavum]